MKKIVPLESENTKSIQFPASSELDGSNAEGEG